MPKPPMNARQSRKRREAILIAALNLASKTGGWSKLTRAAIAVEANCSDGLVSRYLGSMEALRNLLVKRAIKEENYDILIQAFAAGHPEAKKVRVKALAHLTNQ